MNTLSVCEGCGGAFDPAALEAFVIRCSRCGRSYVSAGGALGLTRTTAIEDPNLSYDIVRRAIDVCSEHRRNYNGLLQSHLAERDLPADHYLAKPPGPDLLEVEAADNWRMILARGACFAPVLSVVVFPLLWTLLAYLYWHAPAGLFRSIFSFLLLHRGDGTSSGGVLEVLNLYGVSLIVSTPIAASPTSAVVRADFGKLAH